MASELSSPTQSSIEPPSVAASGEAEVADDDHASSGVSLELQTKIQDLVHDATSRHKEGIHFPITHENGFRLLVLFRADQTGGLKGVLIDQVIGGAIPYQCLSYTWGNSETDRSIDLGQQRLPITKNLDSALRVCRSQIQPELPWILMWADGVCVNQNDLKERNQQVQRMRRIYGDAQQVIAHLGNEADGSELVPELFEKMAKASEKKLSTLRERAIAPAGNGYFGFWHEFIEPRAYETLGLPPENDLIWYCFAKFLDRAWFRRVWIVQEAALARKLLIICGKWSLDAPRLALVVETATRHGLWKLSRINVANDAQNHFFLMSLLSSRRGPLQKLPLIDLLHHADFTLAGDPRDHINALLSLSFEEDMTELQPRYDEPVLNTFSRFAEHTVRNGDGVKLLFTACCYERIRHLPSWCPNLRSPARRPQLMPTFYGKSAITEMYPLAGGTSSAIRIGNFGDLVVRAIRLGVIQRLERFRFERFQRNEVARMGSFTERRSWKYMHSTRIKKVAEHYIIKTKGSPEYRLSRLILADIETLLSKISTYTTGEDKEEILWRTAVLNKQLDNRREASDNERVQFQAFRLLEKLNRSSSKKARSLVINHLEAHTGRRVKEFDSQAELGDELAKLTQIFSTRIARYTEEIISVALTMRPCMLSSKHIGQVPSESTLGDVVYVILGASAPFVLRPKENGAYILLGPCYVHGLMKGEALKMEQFNTEDIHVV